MTQPAQADPSETPVASGAAPDRDEVSGRFVIEGARESGTILPPAEAGMASPTSLDQVAPIAEDELELVAAVAPGCSARTSLPPPVPEEVIRKSLAPRSVEPIVTHAQGLEIESALEPHYRGLSHSDRAEPRIEDLSLRLDNPFAASSLVPPPDKPFAAGKWVFGAAGIAAVLFGGYVLATRGLHVPPPAHAGASVRAATLAAATTSPEVVTAPSVTAPVPAVAVPEPTTTVSATPAAAAELVVEKVPAATAATAERVSEAPASTLDSASAQAESAAPVAATAASAAADGTATVAAATAASLEAQPGDLEAAASVDVAHGEAAQAAAEPPAEALPEAPSREQIILGFEAVRASVEACAAGAHGVATAKVTLAGAGRVANAVIEGAFAGTPQGSCMARAVRKAQFPRFASPTFTVAYPFAL